MKAQVFVTLKKGVLDPQGKAVEESLHSLGFVEAHNMRIGRYVEMEIDGLSENKARERLKMMCEKLLANPVIEDYRVEIEG
ncbi:MAG: phosphoribosylformylglycinamidine synthase subunit PurS [Thermodesulfobacteriota bacterium]